VAGVMPGQKADDSSYVPAIARVRERLGRRGLLYVGDGKMGALQTRPCIHDGGDYYLYPLSESHLVRAVLADDLAPV
jgi:transposase